jgi:hypothetical protein
MNEDKVSIELDQPHNHAGVDQLKGAIISVSPETADWLEANKIGHRSAGRRIVAPKASTPTE